jgi:hypothetical protein
VELADCDYCFGCVGLNGAEFLILNEPYSRQDYFEITGQLRKQLAARDR